MDKTDKLHFPFRLPVFQFPIIAFVSTFLTPEPSENHPESHSATRGKLTLLKLCKMSTVYRMKQMANAHVYPDCMTDRNEIDQNG